MGGILRVRVLAAAISGYEIGRAFFSIRLPNRRQTLRHLAPRLCGYFPGETSRFGWRPLVGYQHGQIGEARHASGRHGRSQALANAQIPEMGRSSLEFGTTAVPLLRLRTPGPLER